MSGAEAGDFVVSDSIELQMPPALADLLRRDEVPLPADLGIKFDEEFYLKVNGDVARAVAVGAWRSGFHHYLMHGMSEGRNASPAGPDPAMRITQAQDDALANLAQQHNGTKYLTPGDLRVTELPLRRVMVIGSCLLMAFDITNRHAEQCQADFLLTNNLGELPNAPPHDPSEYDLQIIQLALRSVLHDHALWHIPYSDGEQHKAVFESTRDRLAVQLNSLMAWNKTYGIPSFVMNFMVPQESPLGRLLPRYDLRNPVFFIERLNMELEHLLSGYKNAYLLDIDKISASLGRRYIQDDAVAHFAHGSVMGTPGVVNERIETLEAMTAHYEIRWSPAFIDAVWEEISAMYRTLRQIDAVKLVVVDLDDTIWNGVSGEMETVGPEMLEGWPLGVSEALAFLKKRGVLLAIISKNDDERVRSRWDSIFFGRLRLDDFAVRRINWNSKTQNMHGVLADLNLLPRNTVFIDDNPVERVAMRRAFPEMRVLGRYPYYLRRILLWSPEIQVPTITDESNRRTAMVQAQVERENLRKTVSRDEFLRSLNVKVQIFSVSADHPRFARGFELLNKTNQFNTTGKRWRAEELVSVLESGTQMVAFAVQDEFTSYGLVGVLLVRGAEIMQFVMSCRVVGLNVERAALATVIDSIRVSGREPIAAAFIETEANLLCRDLFPSCGFIEGSGGWLLLGDTPTPPHHVCVEFVS